MSFFDKREIITQKIPWSRWEDSAEVAVWEDFSQE